MYGFELIYMNNVLGDKNKKLSDYISEIEILRAITPICSFCKKIRDDEGYWQTVESYMSQYIKTNFSHGVCPECMREHYPKINESPK